MRPLLLFDPSGQSLGKLSESIVKRAMLLLRRFVVMLEQRTEINSDFGRSNS